MKLSKKILGIMAVILVVWIAVLAGLVVNASSSSSEARLDRAGAFAHTVEALDQQGLTISAISPADVYGEEWIAGAIVCSRETPESAGERLDIDPAELEELGPEVPDDTNYLLLRTQDGTVGLDPMDRSQVELCSVPLAGYFNTYDMMPVAKTEAGGWVLLI